MRGNGLQAENYVAVADLDPRTADVLLAELRDRGVAAYAADSPDPGPSGAVDRLYVDATAEHQVRSMIDDQLGTIPDAGAVPPADADAAFYDSAFADIVAGFHQSPGRQLGSWSASEDIDAPEAPGPPDDASAGSEPPAATGVTGTAAARSYTGWDDLLRPEPPAPDPLPDPEDRYVPPPPPPLPKVDLRTRIAWACVVGGPGVLFAAAILGWQLSSMQLLLAAVAFLGGFVALVARLKDRDDDGDGDDGAVV